MVSVAVVIVGINQWEEWTQPAIASLKTHDPQLHPFIVDNGSAEPYPLGEYVTVRIPETVCYSAAINAGMLAAGDADWMVILNNDITVTGSIQVALSWLSPHALYGNQLIVFNKLRWLGLWLFVISREVREAVGLFDENFAVCGFDDCDYCLRAAKKGFAIEKSNLPITHHWGKTRWDIPNYKDIREENLKYLEEKHSVSLAGKWEVFD